MELRLVNPLEHGDSGALHHLVLDGRNSQQPLLAIGFGDHPTARRAWVVATTTETAFEALQAFLQVLSELLCRHPVHARRTIFLQLHE